MPARRAFSPRPSLPRKHTAKQVPRMLTGWPVPARPSSAAGAPPTVRRGGPGHMEPASPEARQFVLEQAKANNVRFIKLWFTDILGYLKSFSITMEELEASMIEGRGFDGSSIDGFVRIDESDMIAMPDPTTFVVLPWRSDDERRRRRPHVLRHLPAQRRALPQRPALCAQAQPGARRRARLHLLRRAGAGVLLLPQRPRRPSRWTRAATST